MVCLQSSHNHHGGGIGRFDGSDDEAVQESGGLYRRVFFRSLSSQSAQRNIGVAFGYSLQAIRQTISGMGRVQVNSQKITEALESNWEVLAEPIQTVLRKYGIPDAYDRLKELTRGKRISKEDIQEFIKSLDVLSPEDRENLLQLTPEEYVGYACQIAEKTANK